MKMNDIWSLDILVVTVLGALVLAGCSKKSETGLSGTSGGGVRTGATERVAVRTVVAATNVAERTRVAATNVGERTRVVATNVAGRTVDAARASTVAAKEAREDVVRKTRRAYERAGAAVEEAGENMQK